MKKSFITLFAIVISISLLMGCSGASTQEQSQTNAVETQTPVQTVSAVPNEASAETDTQEQIPTAAGTELQASDAAKAAADVDDTGAPYFVAYEYDSTNYLVSSYQTQQSPGDYSGGGDIYLVNKESGEVLADNEVDLSKVDFSKILAVYSKSSGEIIE